MTLMRLLLAFLFLPLHASACRCPKKQTADEAWESAQAIFSGRVLDVKKDAGATDELKVKVDFEVLEAWKGPKGKRVSVHTSGRGPDCGFVFKKGEKYMVYAFGEKLLVDQCSRTVALDGGKLNPKPSKKMTAQKSSTTENNLFWEFHKRDFNAIAQMILDDSRLEPYFKVDSKPERKPLYLIENRYTRTARQLSKFGEPVRVLEAFKMAKESPYFDFTDVTFGKDSARVQFAYEAEKLKGDVTLKKEPSGWKIERYDLVQQ